MKAVCTLTVVISLFAQMATAQECDQTRILEIDAELGDAIFLDSTRPMEAITILQEVYGCNSVSPQGVSNAITEFIGFPETTSAQWDAPGVIFNSGDPTLQSFEFDPSPYAEPLFAGIQQRSQLRSEFCTPIAGGLTRCFEVPSHPTNLNSIRTAEDLILSAVGNSSILPPGRYQLTIRSIPSGALVRNEGVERYTETAIWVRRGREDRIEIVHASGNRCGLNVAEYNWTHRNHATLVCVDTYIP